MKNYTTTERIWLKTFVVGTAGFLIYRGSNCFTPLALSSLPLLSVWVGAEWGSGFLTPVVMAAEKVLSPVIEAAAHKKEMALLAFRKLGRLMAKRGEPVIVFLGLRRKMDKPDKLPRRIQGHWEISQKIKTSLKPRRGEPRRNFPPQASSVFLNQGPAPNA